jgi:hypothetical protein
MIAAKDSARIFALVKAPAAPRSGSLADKLQRLVLEQPRAAVQLEQLVDILLVADGAR